MQLIQHQNIASSVITVTDTATLLFALVDTAGSVSNSQQYLNHPNNEGPANGIIITPEDGDIRLGNGKVPTASLGMLLQSGVKYKIPNIKLENIRLIRAGLANVKCSIDFIKSHKEDGIEVGIQNVVVSGVSVSNFPTEYPLPTAQVTTLTPPSNTGYSTSAKQLPDNHQVKVTDVITGVGATNLGKAKGSTVGATDTGVAILGKLSANDKHTSEDEGDYDTFSMTDFHELRTRDQRAIDLANCNVSTDYTVLSNDTANLANSTNHVFGIGGIKFDKVNGAADTVFAGVSKSFTAINLSEIFEAGGFVGLGAYLPSLTNVVNVFLRIGTDANNYNCWTWAVADLIAATWLNLRKAAAIPDGAKNTGTGWNTGAVAYVAFGVEFAVQTNTLADILFDHVHLVGGRVTSTDLSAAISSSVTTPNVNINRVGGVATDTNNGTAAGGTLRVTIASDSTGQIKLAAGTNLAGDVGLSGARTTGGTTMYKNLDVDESEDAVKASAGQIFWIHAINLKATPLYLKFYNNTVAGVTVGTTVPDLTFPVPSLATTNGAGFCLAIPNGIAFSTAITVACTTGFADADTGAPGNNEMIINLGIA